MALLKGEANTVFAAMAELVDCYVFTVFTFFGGDRVRSPGPASLALPFLVATIWSLQIASTLLTLRNPFLFFPSRRQELPLQGSLSSRGLALVDRLERTVGAATNQVCAAVRASLFARQCNALSPFAALVGMHRPLGDPAGARDCRASIGPDCGHQPAARAHSCL
jgi:hypothetical protein